MLKGILLCILFSLGQLEAAESKIFEENRETLFQKISEKALYFGMGTTLGSLSLLAELGGRICSRSSIGNECLLLSDLSSAAAKHIFSGPAKNSLSSEVHSSFHSWHLNQMRLSQIPAFTEEDDQLLLFLEKRWLAKTAGVYSSVIQWICPCFGISVQLHPETTNTYARDPSMKLPKTYKNRIEEWKKSLPHPEFFPLILTRPFDVRGYLPYCLDVSEGETIETTVEKMAKSGGAKTIVDLTGVFPIESETRKKWLQTWDRYRAQFSRKCKQCGLNPEEILCIQRIRKGEVGGIRILPLVAKSAKEAEALHQFLLEWVSKFGISANRIELDRWMGDPGVSLNRENRSFHHPEQVASPDKDAFISELNSFDQNWQSSSPQKTLMFKGAMQTLKGLFSTLREDRWNEAINSPTRSAVIQLSFNQIKEELISLSQNGEEISFFDAASRIEEIHAHLTSLLEIISPFALDDFPKIYLAFLTSIPENLKPLTSCGIHSTGMTSLSGILKAVERTAGSRPRVLYGENTYFENIRLFGLSSNAASTERATEEDWKEAALILGQFNPALKRIDFENTLYRVEPIAEILRKSLDARQGKSLTLALDCTLDFLDSPRVGSLLAEFQEEIQKGTLNVICYHSGIKFDLFGMDNYSGAPFYMIHSLDPKWGFFDSLLTDPVLKTDRLSFNWFCLAYQNAVPQLELYRKQVFDNTRALLDKVPARLLEDKNATYRIIPIALEADPSFLDIKIFGPQHQLKASLVGGLLTIKCMEGKHPVFYRPSLGFYHPNLSILFSEDRSTIRLTLGLDPSQVEIIAECFETINALNGKI